MYFGKIYERSTMNSKLNDERRGILRRHLIYYLRVWDLQTNELLGHIVDITTDGVMLISEKEIAVDKRYDLEIRWHNPEDEFQKIRFRAQSRWSSNDVNPDFYDTGFELLDPSEEVLEPIRQMIMEYGFEQ